MTTPIIPTLGIHFDIPAETYFAWDACNASRLKILARSAKHLRYAMDNPQEPTPALIVGSAAHCAVYEAMSFKQRFRVADDCAEIVKASGRVCGNAGKVMIGGRWRCGVHSKGLTPDDMPTTMTDEGDVVPAVLTMEQATTISAMASSVMSDRAARDLVTQSRHEVCIVWDDPATGVRCKARLDGFNPESKKINDLKTCEDASEDGFMRQIADYGYAIQAAFYLDAATAVNGEIHDEFYFIAAEKTAPFVAAVWKADKALVDLGRAMYRSLLEVYKVCKEADVYPGYHDHVIQPISIPKWYWEKESKKN